MTHRSERRRLTNSVGTDHLTVASAGREKRRSRDVGSRYDRGEEFQPTRQSRWKTNEDGMSRLVKADQRDRPEEVTPVCPAFLMISQSFRLTISGTTLVQEFGDDKVVCRADNCQGH